MNIQLNTAKKIADKLISNGFETYFAGGYVRDKILGIESHDIDIATSAEPEVVENLFKKTISIGKQFGVIVVIDNNINFEVATFRADGKYIDGRRPESVIFTTAEQDAKRRDITINALFMDPKTEEIIDFVNGKEDIKNKIIKMVGIAENRIKEDFLRIIRVIRFSARFNFEIEEKTKNALCSLKNGLTKISKERIADEITKICKHNNTYNAFKMFYDLDIEKFLFPKELVNNNDKKFQFIKKLENDQNINLITLLSCYSFKFFKDNIANKKIYKKIVIILKNMKFSLNIANNIAKTLILTEKINNSKNSDLAYKKEIIADKMYINSKNLFSAIYEDNLELLKCFNEIEKKYSKIELKPIPYITGIDLKKIGISAGPEMGSILKKVYNEQLNEIFNSKNDAIKWIKKTLF